jgi:hypothetical protein
MRSDARRRGDRQGLTRAHICEKSLMPLARTAPSPASPFTESGASRQARAWFYVGSYPPQTQTTISNRKYVTQILRNLPCVTLNPGPEGCLKAGARLAILFKRPPSRAAGDLVVKQFWVNQTRRRATPFALASNMHYCGGVVASDRAPRFYRRGATSRRSQ